MEFENDLMSSLRSRVQPKGLGTDSPRLDWPGLHARFSAAHAARCVLGVGESGGALPVGSFADWARADHSGANASHGVNLTDSTDGKEPCRMTGDIAEQPMIGGRGQ